MALDVRLCRDEDEPWGFELFGGADEEMPLTIEKIQPDSPAKRAGLLNGDTILTINGQEAIDWSLKTACRRVAESGDNLIVGVLRGLYDPVLDDQEPIYDYEPEDLEQQLEPTEVSFKIQQFVEPSDLGSNLLDFGDSPLLGANITLFESRSLTSSPFVTPTKPYRPFSTEPLPEVPPLEDPIILNPNYRDEFGKIPADTDPDYILNAHFKNGLEGIQGRFKLPISEQYDPDGKRFVQNVEITDKLLKYEKHIKSINKDLEVVDVTKETKVCDSVSKDVTESLTTDVILKDVRITEERSSEDIKHEEFIKKDSQTTEKKEIFGEEVEEEAIKEELQFIEKMRQKTSLEKIEETAMSVVENSIEKAMSVAEEIKKEISEELVEKKDISKSVQSEKIQKSEVIIDETDTLKTEKQTKTVPKEFNLEDVETKIEKREELIESSDKTSYFKDVKEASEKVAKEDGKIEIERKSVITEEHEEIIGIPIRKESLEHGTVEGKFEKKGEFIKVTKTVTNGATNAKKGAEQRAYTIGLQTIPNIRGVVHSSYHYDLLLRTFFIHLTDVMVALSRFVLTQPIFNEVAGSQETVTETNKFESAESAAKNAELRKSTQEIIEITKKIEKQRAKELEIKEGEAKQERKEVVKPVPVKGTKQEMKVISQKIEKDMKVESVQEKRIEKIETVKPVAGTEIKEIKEDVKVQKKDVREEQMIGKESQVTEKKALSGAQMAQRSEKKLPQELTQKMDPVISEFQTIAVEEDVKKEMLQRSLRSRSKSQIEEEVMKESDPLEWLAKVDSRRTSQERNKKSEKEFSSSESTEKMNKVKSKYETTHKKPKTPKQTYVAIVEAHVYTNKDAIFEEQFTEFSETSSVQSAEEINTAFEAIETLSTENVALENVAKDLQTANVVQEVQELAIATAKNAATAQKIEEVMHDSKELIQEEYKKETALQSSDIPEVLIQETKEIVEPLVEIKESKIDKVEKAAVDINESLSIAESSEINVHESKSDFTKLEMKTETALQSSDIQSVLIQETKEIVEPILEIKETKIDKVKKVAVDISESLSIAESTEINIHESKNELSNVEMKTETVAIVEEERALETVVESKPEIVEPEPIVEEVTETVIVQKDVIPVIHDEYASLKIIKKVETEGSLSPEIIEIEDISEDISTSKSVINQTETSKQLEMGVAEQMSQKSIVSESSMVEAKSVVDIFQSSQVCSQKDGSSISKQIEVSKQFQPESKELVQKSSFTARSEDKRRSLRLDLERQISSQSPPSTIDTPTPSTVPPTPLTDEYIFKLSIPLPRSRSATPIPRDSTLTPEDEDPHIVKKKLVPHIETTIERVLYDPPLPTPPADKVQTPVYTKPGLNGSGVKAQLPFYTKPGLKGGAVKVRFPVYRKPGLFGGADRPEYSKEEIREIERKSSLLASAIDETIKSIEEYKEEVGIETKKEVKIQEFKEEKVCKNYHESYSKELTVEPKKNGLDEIETRIEEIIEQCDALATINNDNENKTNIVEKEIKKESTKIESKAIEPISQIESKVKSVKFDNEAKDVEVITSDRENVEDKVIETQNKESAKASARYETVIDIKQTDNDKIDRLTNDVSKIATESRMETAKTEKVEEKTEKSDVLLGFRPVIFDPEGIQKPGTEHIVFQESTGTQEPRQSPYMTETGELIGTIKGIVDGLEDPVIDEEVAKELGKPGISEEKIAELLSGEAEMLREAHVMGLSRVLTSHMHRADDSSVDFEKIKPMIESLKDSEVLKALNEELARKKAEEKKKEEKRWTTFLQKPKRPVPKAKFGYHGWTEDEQVVAEPYRVKIVKQAKPKVAPDYKPEDFETGPLPWEERAVTESSLPPVEPEEPILIPEVPEFLEAVDPLKESEVPDLEDSGIPLPPPKEPTPPPIIVEEAPEPEPVTEEDQEETVAEAQEEKKETTEDMENRLAEQLVRSVQGMVDPNASIDQQLSQMRAQLAALAQLPEVIQQSLELVSKQVNKMTQQEPRTEMSESNDTENQNYQQVEADENNNNSEMQTIQEENENNIEATEATQNVAVQENNMETGQQNMGLEQEDMKMTTPVMTEEDIRLEKQKKEQARLEHEARQIKQHPTPRSTKPKRMFGPLDPEERQAVILPGGRRWKNAQDVYDEEKIKETLSANVELIQGRALGFESDLLPYDNRINFMKYEKPPVSLDHLKHSEVYKLIHDEDQMPLRRIEMRTPVMSEAEYRERCRSMTPSVEKKHLQIPNQFYP